MSHFVTLEDAVNNDRLEDMGQFINERLPGHVCIPECHEIGGEPESPEMYSVPDDDILGGGIEPDSGYNYLDAE